MLDWRLRSWSFQERSLAFKRGWTPPAASTNDGHSLRRMSLDSLKICPVPLFPLLYSLFSLLFLCCLLLLRAMRFPKVSIRWHFLVPLFLQGSQLSILWELPFHYGALTLLTAYGDLFLRPPLGAISFPTRLIKLCCITACGSVWSLHLWALSEAVQVERNYSGKGKKGAQGHLFIIPRREWWDSVHSIPLRHCSLELRMTL